MSTDPPCDFKDCPYVAEWVITPRKGLDALAVKICDPHHDAVAESKQPREELYRAATRTIRKSLG